jgi:hypothetical protein
MPLVYDDVPGSWGPQSEGWPEVPWTPAAWKRAVAELPYGSYVVVGTRINERKHRWDTTTPYYDHSRAVIRVETEALARLLRDSDAAAVAAPCGDMAVPQDQQARCEAIAQPQPEKD